MPWEKQFDINTVLDKAMQAFWIRGYEATSMQELVSRTGIGRGSLYATYRDKHSLFLAALRVYDDTNRVRRLAELESRYGPREAIRQLFLAFISQISDKGSIRGCLLTNTALELAPRDPEAREIVKKAQKEIEVFFARMIRRGQAHGDIPPQVKPLEAAAGLLATLIGVTVLTRSRPEPALLDSIVADAMRRLT